MEGGVVFLGASDLTVDNKEVLDSGSMEDLTKKEDGKGSVTVASFGFPEVKIEPPAEAPAVTKETEETGVSTNGEDKKIDMTDANSGSQVTSTSYN